jgi:acyl-CoA thioesterase-1
VPQLANYDADLVTAEIGANNMRDYNPEHFAIDYERFLQAMPPGRSVVSDMPYFGGRANTNRNAQHANLTIKRLADQYNIPSATLHATLASQQSPWIYASDFFHPNDRGYRLWHKAFWPPILRIIGQPPL